MRIINSNPLQRVITHPNGRTVRLSKSKKTDREVLDELKHCTLSRYPDRQMYEAVKKFAAEQRKEGVPRRQVFEDVLWALINSKQFLFVD